MMDVEKTPFPRPSDKEIARFGKGYSDFIETMDVSDPNYTMMCGIVASLGWVLGRNQPPPEVGNMRGAPKNVN